MLEQPKRCWCYVCGGRVPKGRSEEGDHILPDFESTPAALLEETTTDGP